MNKFTFLYKLYINKQRRGEYNWNLLFPFVGVILGCMTVSLTLAIMEGMEYEIYNRLKHITFPAKLTHIPNNDSQRLENYLSTNNIDFLHGMEDQVLLMNNSIFRLTNIHAIDDLYAHRKKIFGNKLEEININSQLPAIYIGKSLSMKLDIMLGDTAEIVVPKQINIFTGMPLKRAMIIGGIYEMEVLDYDQKHIFTNYNSVKNLFKEDRLLYYLHEIPDDHLSELIGQNFPKLQLHTWEYENLSFISAMKLEKVAYSIIGFLIVIIASFTLMSIMSLAVMQKVPQIGILRAMGAKKQDVGAIFIIQALITWIISSITGIILSVIIIELDKHYHLIQILFPEAIFFDFPLILHNEYIFLIMLISLILLLSAAIYPSLKAAYMDPIQAIGLKR